MERQSLSRWTRQDWAVNPELKSRLVLAWFRLAQRCRIGQTPLPRVLERFVDRSYRHGTALFLATEIHPSVQIGPRLRVFHCHAVVLNPGTVLGADCTLRVGNCLGNKTLRDGSPSEAPVLGDRVDLGVGALVIGPVSVGDGTVVGAGAVVVSDASAGSVLVGNPARPLGARERVAP